MVVQMQPFLAANILSIDLKEVGRPYNAGDNAMDWIKEISRDVLTPAYVLRRLAASSDAEIRIAVADHINTAQAVLMVLSEDKNPDVRYAIAENHNINRDVLLKLRGDDNPFVAHRAQKTLSRLSMRHSPPAQLRLCCSP
jgi:hypothetical protein